GSGTAKIVKKIESKNNSKNFLAVKEIKIIDNRNEIQEEEIEYYKYPEKNKRLSNLFREEIIKIKDIVIHEGNDEEYRSSMICFSFKHNNNNKVGILVERLQEKG